MLVWDKSTPDDCSALFNEFNNLLENIQSCYKFENFVQYISKQVIEMLDIKKGKTKSLMDSL